MIDLEQFLIVKKRELEEQEQQTRQKILLLDSTINWLRKDGNMMGYDVCLKIIPERYAASVREVISGYQEEGVLWHTLMTETAPLGLPKSDQTCALAIFHDGEFKEKDVDVEVQLTITGSYSDTEHVKFKTEPSVQVASVTYQGGYEQITQVNTALAKWINDNGYEYDGHMFNIYHVSPNETQNPDEFITEICYPVRKK